MLPEVTSRRRRSIRLHGYDYANPGGYFVTMCTHEHRCLFGDIVSAEMRLNPLGEIVRDEWLRTAEMRPSVSIGQFVIMPNHMHGIVQITASSPVVRVDHGSPISTEPKGPARASLASMIAGFKSAVSRRANAGGTRSIAPLWQQNYYEHVIRDEDDFNRIRQYIVDNPAQWTEDGYHPSKMSRRVPK